MSTRYLTNTVVMFAGGFVVVASQAFDPAVTGWLALAVGIGVALVAGLAQLERSRGVVQRLHDLAVAVVGLLVTAFGAAFAGLAVKWLSFSLALGLVGLGFSGLTLDEIARWRAEHHLAPLDLAPLGRGELSPGLGPWPSLPDGAVSLEGPAALSVAGYTKGRSAASERQFPADFPSRDLWKPISLLIVSLVPLVVVAFFPTTWQASWSVAVPAATLVLLMVVMLWPLAGTNRYFAYKKPLFIFTILFEAWILLAGVALHFHASIADRDLGFQIMLAGFFLGTVAISLPGVEGEYRKGLFFRPDLIYGNGAYLARGEIFVALGIKLFTSPELAHPIWNWWGLQWALFAMVFMVPFRGILKMRMRRARFLGFDNWMGNGLRPGLWLKEAFLFVSLLMLVYGFANAYMGLAPFTWAPGYPMAGAHGPNWWGFAFLAGAFVVLVPVRGWYKARLAEPAPLGAELVKGLLTWVGFVGIIYGFLLIFMGAGWLALHGAGSPNFWWGVWVSALGFLMVVPLRTVAQFQELKGMLRVMIPRMADLDERTRRAMMGRRLEVVAAMGERARDTNVALMMEIIQEQPEERRRLLVDTRTWVVANADGATRGRLLVAMAAVLGRMEPARRTQVMSEVMASVANLPAEQRTTMVAAMSQVLAGA